MTELFAEWVYRIMYRCSRDTGDQDQDEQEAEDAKREHGFEPGVDQGLNF